MAAVKTSKNGGGRGETAYGGGVAIGAQNIKR